MQTQKVDFNLLLKDEKRIEVLRQANLTHIGDGQIFDTLTEEIRWELDVPIALISVIDAERQFFKGQNGLPEDIAEAGEIPLTHCLCLQVIYESGSVAISDITKHKLFDHPVHRDYRVMAYIGEPLIFNGEIIGAVCGIDLKARDWNSNHKKTLKKITQEVQAEIYFRYINASRET